MYLTRFFLPLAVTVFTFSTLTLYISSTASDGAFYVYLEDVDESGRVMPGRNRLVIRNFPGYAGDWSAVADDLPYLAPPQRQRGAEGGAYIDADGERRRLPQQNTFAREQRQGFFPAIQPGNQGGFSSGLTRQV